MAKKVDSDQYLTQAYQSPYNQQLFPKENKAEFEKHLRQEARFAKERETTAAEKAQRLQLWTQLRQSATCLEDVPVLLMALPSDLGTYYRKRAFFKEIGGTGWSLTLEGKPTLAAQCITHKSPLDQPTNWGGKDKDRATYLLGLQGAAKENLNYDFSEAHRESGIATTNNDFILFADDWPFVAKLALVGAFGKDIKVPEKFFPYNDSSKKITADYTRFWNDINKYSIAYVGMPYAELQGMRDTLGLGVEDLKSMMATYEDHGHNPPEKGLHLELPEGMGDIAMPGLGA